MLKVGVVGSVLVTLVTPRGDGGAVEDHHLEESVQQQDDIRLHAVGIEVHGCRGPGERVAEQRRLYHDQHVGGGVTHQFLAVVRRFVGRAIEYLEERRTPQVEHELRVQRQFRWQRERLGFIFFVARELGAPMAVNKRDT